jgi:hypothetical protein
MHADSSRQDLSAVVPVELGSSPRSKSHQAGGLVTPSELSTIPPTPEVSSASPSKAFAAAIPRRAVPTSTSSTSWSNAPWQNEGFPEAGVEQAPKAIPLVSANEEEDELRRIEDEERRIDAVIAESERIRAIKEEKAVLQARKAELLAGRQSGSRS